MDEESNPAATHQGFDLWRLGRHFSERSPQPMLVVEGPAHMVRHVNSAFLRLAGADSNDLVGHPFALALPEGMVGRCLPLLDRTYCTGAFESLAEQKDGESPSACWSYLVWAILGSGEFPVGVMIQVTALAGTALLLGPALAISEPGLRFVAGQDQLAEAAGLLNACLEAAVMGRESLLAALSHELRTPLTPVLLAASLLQRDLRLDADTRDVMAMIQRNITQESRLIDSLLDVVARLTDTADVPRRKG